MRQIQLLLVLAYHLRRCCKALSVCGAYAGGQTTGYGSSQVEEDRTGGKAQAGGPKPTEHGTLPRPGAPSREDSTGREEGSTTPRTGTTGDDGPDMK